MRKLLIYISIFFSLCFLSCGISNSPGLSDFNEKEGIKYSIIYIIHGDGSYLYHDSSGKGINADERMVEQAKYVAENSFASEVFIFHIKPKRHFLFFFPLKDRELLYYNKGRLLKKESYYTIESYNNLELESRYYKRLTQNSYLNPRSGSIKSFFLYYGHQIPEYGGDGYNSSYTNMTFNIDNFVTGLSQFRRYSAGKFEMVLLSTCNNGTPGVISRLIPYSKYAIASPGDLHLSYINSTLLIDLNYLKEYNLYSFIQKFASSGFDNLKSNTKTVVTVSVYDVGKVTPFLENIKQKYTDLLIAVENSKASRVNCVDCLESRLINTQYPDSGVVVFHRPPQFGKAKSLVKHSGWGCIQLEKLH